MSKVSLEEMDRDLTLPILIGALGKALVKKGILRREDIIEHVISLAHDNPNNDYEKNFNRIVIRICDIVNKW